MPFVNQTVRALRCSMALFMLAQVQAQPVDVSPSLGKVSVTPVSPATPMKSGRNSSVSPSNAPSGGAAAPSDGQLDALAERILHVVNKMTVKQRMESAGASVPSTRHKVGAAAAKMKKAPTEAPQTHAMPAANTPADAKLHAQHWSYDGLGAPANWAKLNPDFQTCANGKRQSPIVIDDGATLQGPAEPLTFDYRPTTGVVVNNGHTIQVNFQADNQLNVRGSAYRLLQMHFHHPSEERINQRDFPMVAHLVHRNDQNQLAVVAVLLTSGEANPVIETIWKYMPLDQNDQVSMPSAAIDLNELLPSSPLYYQYMGSLTTPPCTEGVLWLIMKSPMTLSPAQIRMFGQLFPNNARPPQPTNGRPVREGM